MLQLFVLVHLCLDVFGQQGFFQLGVKGGGRRLHRVGLGQRQDDIDRIEKVAGRLAGVVIAQVDRQTDGDGLAALQGGHLSIDGQHQRSAEIAGQRDAQLVGAGQHLFGA